MRTTYDREADAFHASFVLEGTVVSHTQEVAPGVFVDFDANGSAIGVEVLSVGLRATGEYPTVGRASVAAD